jgi:hypothetical protein
LYSHQLQDFCKKSVARIEMVASSFGKERQPVLNL